MFFLFISVPRHQTVVKRLLPPPPPLQARRRGKWKNKSSQPIDKVMFAVPHGWERDEIDPKTVMLDGPVDESGLRAAIRVEVVEGPDNARHLYDELLKHQSQAGFTLVSGGVIERDRGLQAAELQFTCESEGTLLAVREMVFTVGFRAVAHAQAICPVNILPRCGSHISAFFDGFKPSRRLEVPGSIRAGL